MNTLSGRLIGLLLLVLATGCGNGGDGAGGTGGAGGDGGGDDAGGANAGGGGPCGESGMPCPEGQFCSWHYGSCGKNNSVDFAECVDVATDCGPNSKPACACDGKIYASVCEATARGVDVGQTGDCAEPEGRFLCGSYLCTTGEEYCHLNDIIDAVNATCEPLPSGCTDCDCLLPGGGGQGGGGPYPWCTCAAGPDHLTVSCEGGGI